MVTGWAVVSLALLSAVSFSTLYSHVRDFGTLKTRYK